MYVVHTGETDTKQFEYAICRTDIITADTEVYQFYAEGVAKLEILEKLKEIT